MKETESIEMTPKSIERLKNNHFTTPEGYFEHLSARVLQRIDNQEAQPAKVTDIRSKGKRYIAIAASVMALFTLGSVYSALQRHEARSLDMQAKATQQQVLSTDALDMAVDYTMCDNDDIFAFLMEE